MTEKKGLMNQKKNIKRKVTQGSNKFENKVD